MKKIITLTENDLTRIVKRVIKESSNEGPIIVNDPKDPRLLKYNKQYEIWKKGSEKSVDTKDYWLSKGFIKTGDMIGSLKQKLIGFGLKEGTKCFNSAFNHFNKKINEVIKESKTPNNFYQATMHGTEYKIDKDYKPHSILFYWKLELTPFSSGGGAKFQSDSPWDPTKVGCAVGKFKNKGIDLYEASNVYWKKPQEVKLVEKPTVTSQVSQPTKTQEPVVEPKPQAQSTQTPKEKEYFQSRLQTIINKDGSKTIKTVPYSKKVGVNGKWVDVDAPRVIDYRTGEKKYDGGRIEKITN